MRLIIVLRLLVSKDDVQCDMVALLHHWPGARHHAPDVKAHDTRHGFEPLVRAGDQFVSRVRLVRISPKDDNMRKHSRYNPVRSGPAQQRNSYVAAEIPSAAD